MLWFSPVARMRSAREGDRWAFEASHPSSTWAGCRKMFAERWGRPTRDVPSFFLKGGQNVTFSPLAGEGSETVHRQRKRFRGQKSPTLPSERTGNPRSGARVVVGPLYHQGGKEGGTPHGREGGVLHHHTIALVGLLGVFGSRQGEARRACTLTKFFFL